MDPKMAVRLRNPAKQTMFGVIMQQSWNDLWLWEQLLNSRPEIRSIIEIGTKHGGFSLYLRSQAAFREIFFWTCDIQACPLSTLKTHFLAGNVFRNNGDDFRKELNGAPHPLILFCDGGDKRMEVRIFAPILCSGDIVGVHDWGSEIDAKDMQCTVQYLVPVMLSECEDLNSITRFWMRK